MQVEKIFSKKNGLSLALILTICDISYAPSRVCSTWSTSFNICVIWRKIRHGREMSIVSCLQIKMARSALGWSTQKLSDESGVSARTLNRIETDEGFLSATIANLKLVEITLQAAGIEFIGDAGEGPGVRLWAKSNQSWRIVNPRGNMLCKNISIFPYIVAW